jgi:hypothetical protein
MPDTGLKESIGRSAFGLVWGKQKNRMPHKTETPGRHYQIGTPPPVVMMNGSRWPLGKEFLS